MKVGDSVRVYESDGFFIEGKIHCVIPDSHIQVDWGEFISYYGAGELKLEHRDGVWSWQPPHVGTILSS